MQRTQKTNSYVIDYFKEDMNKQLKEGRKTIQNVNEEFK
jgi:hypothetical protein